MIATIITIGDELLIGQVINTNSTFIASELNKIGVIVGSISVVGDDEEAILKTFTNSYSGSSLVIVTGGLGPTHDDVTKKCVCKFFNVNLIQSEEVKKDVERILSLRKIEWSKAAEEQTFVPKNCQIIPNELGTAAGFLFERDNKIFIVLPGVPREMQNMMQGFVIPYLRKKIGGWKIYHKTLRTTGITEAALSELIGNIDELLINTHEASSTLAFLPSPTGVSLRISVKAENELLAENILRIIDESIYKKAGKFIYGYGDDDLETVVGRILTEKNLTLSVAESCTGGMIAHKLTNVPGSSKYFDRGIIAYSNRSKIQLLGVDENLINTKGAVSQEVAMAMAEGVRKVSGSNIGLSTTGIAGPTGGSIEKPIGLVWIGYSDQNETMAIRNYFGNNRILVKTYASQAALNLVRLKLLQIKI